APPPAEALALAWEGPLLREHSLALVNRQLCLGLLQRGHDVRLLPTPSAGPEVSPSAALAPLLARLNRPPARPAEVRVRPGWPPRWEAPREGRWVVIQPWEFGSLPRDWVGPVARQADEVWAYTRSVRDCYVRSGVPADLVHVVPLGVDPARFRP